MKIKKKSKKNRNMTYLEKMCDKKKYVKRLKEKIKNQYKERGVCARACLCVCVFLYKLFIDLQAEWIYTHTYTYIYIYMYKYICIHSSIWTDT